MPLPLCYHIDCSALCTGLYQSNICLAIVGAALLNYYDGHITWGWRLSLGAQLIMVTSPSLLSPCCPASGTRLQCVRASLAVPSAQLQGLATLAGLKLVPETPRFLAKAGQMEEAKATLVRVPVRPQTGFSPKPV